MELCGSTYLKLSDNVKIKIFYMIYVSWNDIDKHCENFNIDIGIEYVYIGIG